MSRFKINRYINEIKQLRFLQSFNGIAPTCLQYLSDTSSELVLETFRFGTSEHSQVSRVSPSRNPNWQSEGYSFGS